MRALRKYKDLFSEKTCTFKMLCFKGIMNISLHSLSLIVAIIGLGFFLWPVVQRLRGNAPNEPETLEQKFQLRSKVWWIGFILTILALFLQRAASTQGG
jgi:hypothetical protein